jgi:uncharacterized integral membrane protein (TIGR00698 family)
MTYLQKIGPGLLLVIGVALLAQWLTLTIWPLIGAVTLAILLGIVVGNLPFIGTRSLPGFDFAEKKLLPLAIVFLGAELQLRVLVELGVPTILLILIVVGVTLGSSLLLGRLLGFGLPFSLLMGAGTAVCGASAIAAIAPLVKSNEEEVGLSVGAVNLLGTVGVFLLPPLVLLLGLDAVVGGAVIGGSLQAVGHVVAAGYAINDETGAIALLVKMGRVLLLGPLALLVGWLAANGKPAATRQPVRVPNFIIGFFLVSVVVSVGVLPEGMVDFAKLAGKWLLLLAMAGIGLKIRLTAVFQQGPKTLLFGALLALLQLIVVLALAAILYSAGVRT